MSCIRVLFCLPPKTEPQKKGSSKAFCTFDHQPSAEPAAKKNETPRSIISTASSHLPEREKSLYFDAWQSTTSGIYTDNEPVSLEPEKNKVNRASSTRRRSSMLKLRKSISKKFLSRRVSKRHRCQSLQVSHASYDDRPLINDLLQQHSSDIKIVRDKIKEDPLYDSERYDDIWILRFILSHKKKNKDAINAALKTMKFRHERKLNELGDIRHKLLDMTNKCESENYFQCHRFFYQYCEGNDAVMHTLPDEDRGLISYILLGKFNMKEASEKMSDEELQDAYLYLNEISFQILDAVTRNTGKLTKLLKVVDLTDVTLRKASHSYMKKDAAASKLTEDYYPQLLGSVLVVNAPSWVNRLWMALRPLFPHRFVEKVNFLSPRKRPQDVEPFLRYVSRDDLPERYGGENADWPLVCAGDLFQNVPN